MTNQLPGAPCRTCERPLPPDEFYAGTTECRDCKKERSRQSRLLAARKIAFAERVIDLLIDLTGQGWRPDLCEHANRGPDGAVNTEPSPSIGRLGVQP